MVKIKNVLTMDNSQIPSKEEITFEKCQKELAKKYSFKFFDLFTSSGLPSLVMLAKLQNEAAELYATLKTKELQEWKKEQLLAWCSISDNALKWLKERDSLKQENEKLKQEKDLWHKLCLEQTELAKKREQENERLREALKWYADSGNYLHTDQVVATAWEGDNMEMKAKQALKPLNK